MSEKLTTAGNVLQQILFFAAKSGLSYQELIDICSNNNISTSYLDSMIYQRMLCMQGSNALNINFINDTWIPELNTYAQQGEPLPAACKKCIFRPGGRSNIGCSIIANLGEEIEGYTYKSIEENLARPEDYKYVQGGIPFVFRTGKLFVIYHYYDFADNGMVVNSMTNPYDSDLIMQLCLDGNVRNFRSGLLKEFHGGPCEVRSIRQGGDMYPRI